MKGLKVLNRGFGGSTIAEAIYYSDILIFKHKPKQIVFYAGENDISTPESDSMKVYSSFVYLQKLIKQKLPETQLYYISIKLSPVRAKYWNTIKSLNKMIEQYCNSNQNCTFIDVNKAMIDNNLKIRGDFYLEDSLHLNEKGYQIWASIISKELKIKINKRL
jgi:lysophospholipase L1-like esterase